MNIPEDNIPATLEEAINVLASSLTSEEVDYIKRPDTQSGRQHFFGGMAIRNRWGLWKDSVLALHFKTRFGLGCGDDMSSMILKGVWQKVRGEPYDPQGHADYFHDFWRMQRRDPLTQEVVMPPPPPVGRRPLKPALPPRNRYRRTWLDRLGDFWSGLFPATR